MPGIFTKIINREIPGYIVAETPEYIAFLDVFPLAEGHVLVVPRIETDYLFDMDDQQLGGIIVFAKKVARALEKSVSCKRIGVAVIGLEVPHAHIHLIPLHSVADINFSRPKLKVPAERLQQIADLIRTNFEE
ncbi:MAG: HIT family protein [Chitinophagales bacterium]